MSAQTVYVGVDLIAERVEAISLSDYVPGYLLRGETSGLDDGVIYLDTTDQTYNGRRAREIALAENASGEIGLGWRFAVRLSDEWSR